MKQIKDLTDDEINYWVAKAQGFVFREGNGFSNPAMWMLGDDEQYEIRNYKPVSNWSQAGELLEKFLMDVRISESKINMYRPVSEPWNYHYIISDRDYKKAICLAVIVSIYGEEIEE